MELYRYNFATQTTSILDRNPFKGWVPVGWNLDAFKSIMEGRKWNPIAQEGALVYIVAKERLEITEES